MKSTGKKSIHKLIIDDQSNHHFFGIATTEPDYKLSLKINEVLNIRLKSDSSVEPFQNADVQFTRFTSRSGFNEPDYQLVKNHNGTDVLSKSFTALDYLFLICNELQGDSANKVREKILSIPEVTAVFQLDNDKLNNEYLILQII